MQFLKFITALTILSIGPSIHASEVDIFKGMKLYAENCAACHMGNLAGHEEWDKSLDEDGHRRAPPLNGTGHTWHHSPAPVSYTHLTLPTRLMV